ncbi:MAG: cohesin domain-containing protein [Pseudomonadota bacterium]|nr:cohesin domain-containing protein [Pseudomonadota bacterium]
MSFAAVTAAGRAVRIAAVLLAILTGGCTAQRAFDTGNELIAQGRTWEGLLRLQEASRLEPRNTAYRLSYINAREQVFRGVLERADAAAARGQYDEAETLYRELLLQDGNYPRALAGQAKVRSLRRRDALFAESQSARAADPQLATLKLRELLSEHPDYAPAIAMLQEIEKENTPPPAEVALAVAFKKPIILEFKDTPLKTIFEVMARSSGLNFLFDKDVRTDTKTSIYLRNSTLENAVRLLCLTNQLEQRIVDANTLLLYPNTPAKQKDYQPLSVRSFYLSNASAKDVAGTLKAILKTRDIVVDDKLNLLIMRDSPTAIRLAEKLVALHDVPEPEVMLEVEILEIKRTKLLDLGVRWPDQATLTPLASSSGDTLTLEDLRNLDAASTGVSITPATINANQQHSDANILANPRIRARNREAASILIGERVPNITTTATSTGFISESVTYVDVGLKLNVEPTIYPDNEVAIDVALEVSNIINQLQTKSGSLAYQIGTRTASTVLRLRDGENQVLAGLINDEDRRTANGVPLLSRVPLLGRLFGSQADDRSKTEIVLSITPRVVRNLQRPHASAAEFETGTETSLASSGGGGEVSSSSAGSSTQRSGPSGTNATKPPSDPTKDNTQNNNQNNYNGTGNSLGVGGITPDDSDPNTPGAVGAAQLRWQGPNQLTVGDTFAVQLLMQSDQPVISLPLAVGFDTNVLQITSITEGEFLRQGGAQTSFNSRVDANGQAIITATRDSETGATALGSVATLNFRVLSASESETRIQLLAISAVGVGGQSINAPLPSPHVVTVAP